MSAAAGFGVLCVVLVFVVEAGRVWLCAAELQRAADAAALAGASQVYVWEERDGFGNVWLSEPFIDGELAREDALRVLERNVASLWKGGGLEKLFTDIEVNADDLEVSVRVRGRFESGLLRLFGISAVELAREASARHILP